MKKLLAFVLCSLSITALAQMTPYRDPGDAVTPWPLEIGRQVISEGSFGGTWFALAGTDSRWILTITPWEDDRSYHWEMYLSSSPSLRSEGVVYLRDQYVIGMIQSPFQETEFILMYLLDGKVHVKLGTRRAPRAEVIFSKKSNEF